MEVDVGTGIAESKLQELTPHKIYLLKLIQLYSTEKIDPLAKQYVGSFLIEQLSVRTHRPPS